VVSPRRDRTEREIIQLCHAGLDSCTLRQELVRQLRKITTIHSFWAATVDPATVLFTGSVVEGIPEHATPLFVRNEFLRDDVNKFVALARGAQVRSLYTATAGELGRSERYREILAPMGLGDELRAALVSDGACWGVLCLHRERNDTPFTDEDVTMLQRLVPHLAEGLRVALLQEDVTAVPQSASPGLVLIADDFSVVASTPAADGWLAEIGDWPSRNEAPQALRAVAARLRELELHPTPDTNRIPRVRVRTRAGRWLVLHAARLSGPATEGLTAVMLEEATPPEVAPLMLQVYALTPRETRVIQLVLRGLSTAEISERLRISALTVQDHLKAIFEKTGVNSRRALVARIFAEQYAARMPDGKQT
jgi:DNA-binding CsgD family transcriptional regulator